MKKLKLSKSSGRGFLSLILISTFTFAFHFNSTAQGQGQGNGGPPLWRLTGNSIDPGQFLGTTNNEPLVLKANGTEFFRISINGNVGVGTSTPSERLDVNGNLKTSGSINTQSGIYYPDGSFQNTAFSYSLDSLHVKKFSVGTGTIHMGTPQNPSGTAPLNSIYANADLYIQSFDQEEHNTIINANHDGYLGVGIETPNHKMHLHSTEVDNILPYRHGSCCDVPVPADTFVVESDGTIDDIDDPAPINPSFSVFQITNANTTDGKQRGLLFRVRGHSSGIEHNETLGNFGISSKSSIGIFADGAITNRAQGVFSSTANVHYFFTNNQSNPGNTLRMTLTNDGKVGIGTSNPSHRLSVVGTIDACEIIVDNFSWCDYVFEEDYERMSWQEKSNYLRINKHLPKIASAKEIQKNGLKTAETMKGMVFNIEENTLDIIDLYKLIEQQQKEIERLKNELSQKQ